MSDQVPLDSVQAFLFWLYRRFMNSEGLDDCLKAVLSDQETPSLAALREMDPHSFSAAEAMLEKLLMVVHDDGPVAEEDVALTFDESRGEA